MCPSARENVCLSALSANSPANSAVKAFGVSQWKLFTAQVADDSSQGSQRKREKLSEHRERFEMAIVAGVDFGTLTVRVSIVDSDRGMLSSAVAEYPLHRKREDPEYATQSHDDHMNALAVATREAIKEAAIRGEQIEAIALDTTGSSVIPVGKNLKPLGE